MCQKVASLIVELIILILSCFGHSKTVWYFGDSYNGGLWLACYQHPNFTEDSNQTKKCEIYNSTVAKALSHDYTETLVCKGFLLSANILAGILMILFTASMNTQKADCTPIGPASFQFVFLLIVAALMTHAFINNNPDSKNKVGASLIVLWLSVPVSLAQLVIISTMLLKCWKKCPLKAPEKEDTPRYPLIDPIHIGPQLDAMANQSRDISKVIQKKSLAEQDYRDLSNYFPLITYATSMIFYSRK